jgi:hypothetical protein
MHVFFPPGFFLETGVLMWGEKPGFTEKAGLDGKCIKGRTLCSSALLPIPPGNQFPGCQTLKPAEAG